MNVLKTAIKFIFRKVSEYAADEIAAWIKQLFAGSLLSGAVLTATHILDSINNFIINNIYMTDIYFFISGTLLWALGARYLFQRKLIKSQSETINKLKTKFFITALNAHWDRAANPYSFCCEKPLVLIVDDCLQCPTCDKQYFTCLPSGQRILFTDAKDLILDIRKEIETKT